MWFDDGSAGRDKIYDAEKIDRVKRSIVGLGSIAALGTRGRHLFPGISRFDVADDRCGQNVSLVNVSSSLPCSAEQDREGTASGRLAPHQHTQEGYPLMQRKKQHNAQAIVDRSSLADFLSADDPIERPQPRPPPRAPIPFPSTPGLSPLFAALPPATVVALKKNSEVTTAHPVTVAHHRQKHAVATSEGCKPSQAAKRKQLKRMLT
jgi:hypothetical protein